MNFRDEADYQRWRALPQTERWAEEEAHDEQVRAEHYQRLAERRARLEQTGCARISDFGQFDVPVIDPVALEATHEAAANPEMACSRCARLHISTVPCDVTLQEQNARLSDGDFPLSTHNKYCDQQHENVCRLCLFTSIGYLGTQYAFDTIDGEQMARDGWHTCGDCSVAWRKSEECKHA